MFSSIGRKYQALAFSYSYLSSPGSQIIPEQTTAFRPRRKPSNAPLISWSHWSPSLLLCAFSWGMCRWRCFKKTVGWWYSLENLIWNLKITQLKRKIICSKPPFFGSMLIFQGVSLFLLVLFCRFWVSSLIKIWQSLGTPFWRRFEGNLWGLNCNPRNVQPLLPEDL